MSNLITSIDKSNLPHHIAIIMDGNGRWAEMRQLHRLEGHRQGIEAVEDIVTYAADLGVEYLTLYAFSQENWSRPSEEVMGLMELLRLFLQLKREKLLHNGIRLKAIGQLELLPEPILKELTKTIFETRHGQKMTLVLALSYGSQMEILDAVNRLLRKSMAEGNPGKVITHEEFCAELYTEFIPDPDLLIRTSGEYRISNFMLWQLAYSELYFTDTLWPDFNREELQKAILEFQKRERRFGKTSQQIQAGEKDL